MQPIRLRPLLNPEARNDMLNDHVFNSVLVCAKPFQQMFDEETQTPSKSPRKGQKRSNEPSKARKKTVKRRTKSKETEEVASTPRLLQKRKEASETPIRKTPKFRSIRETPQPESVEKGAPQRTAVHRTAKTMQNTPELPSESHRGQSESSRLPRKHAKKPSKSPLMIEVEAPEVRVKLPAITPTRKNGVALAREYAALMAQTEKYMVSPTPKRRFT